MGVACLISWKIDRCNHHDIGTSYQTTEKMKEALYRELSERLCVPGTSPQWKTCFELLPHMPMGQRKALANLARAQHLPEEGTKLFDLVCPRLPHSWLHLFYPLYDNPFSAGLLMSMIRLAPFSTDQIKEAYISAMEKERKVMDSDGLPSALNYNVFFGSPHERITPDVPPNPKSARAVQKVIDRWIEKVTKSVHFPSLSRKTTSDESADIARSVLKTYENGIEEDAITQVEMERIYHEIGYTVPGACEMRQRWYPAQLGPRTYFSAGGTAFSKSKHIAKMMTDLCDLFPCTNRYSRVTPSRLRLNEGDHAFIYDLTSFTSNLHEQKHFVHRLAQYCKGHPVTIYDGWEGPLQVDLGDLIEEYNTTNHQERYRLNRVSKGENPPFAHHTAGFLGVYGNIANATFLHGIVMFQLCEDTDELNVAGDDGIKSSQEDDAAFTLLRYLGILEMTKTFDTYEEGCIHLKRPIHQHGDKLYSGSLVLWPSFEYLAHGRDVDPRYPLISELTASEKRDALVSSITGFLTSLSQLALDTMMKDVADSTITWLYDRLSLPYDGYVPQIHGRSYGFVPQYDKRFLGIEPKMNTISRCYQSIARVPLRRYERFEEERLWIDIEFECNSTGLLSYLANMGYLERKAVDILVYGEEGFVRLLKEYFEPDPAVYHYTVMKDIPRWMSIDRVLAM